MGTFALVWVKHKLIHICPKVSHVVLGSIGWNTRGSKLLTLNSQETKKRLQVSFKDIFSRPNIVFFFSVFIWQLDLAKFYIVLRKLITSMNKPLLFEGFGLHGWNPSMFSLLQKLNV